MKKSVFVFLLLLCLPFMHVQAERCPVDAVLVLDVSYSMRHSDPNRLALEAMNLFIEMLGTNNNDRVGIVAYAGNVITYHPMTVLNTKETATQLQSFINGLNHAGWTDHSLGLDKALHILTVENDFTQRLPFMILLTDGNTEISPESLRTYADADADLQRILTQAVNKNIPIYTIGLNHNGTLNQTYIKYIADTTNGRSFETKNAEELTYIMKEILDIQLPFEITFYPNDGIYDTLLTDEIESGVGVLPDDYLNEPGTVILTDEYLNESGVGISTDEQLNEPGAGASTDDYLNESGAGVLPDEHYSLSSTESPTFPETWMYLLAGGFIMFIFIFIVIFFYKTRRVFTGKLIVESAENLPKNHNLIQYGKRTTLHKLNGGYPYLDKIILTPNPYAPSHRPQLLLTCKHPFIKFRKDFLETSAKKGLYISPGSEVTIVLPEDNPEIKLKYVA